jgi:hypothetical protein
MADEKQRNEEESQITVVPPLDLGVISPEPEKVYALAGRMLAELAYPSIGKLTDQERYSLALHALTYKLVPGREIWAIPTKGVMIGRAGWIRLLNDKAEKDGFRWWVQYRIPNAHDLRDAGIEVDKVFMASVCTLRRSDWLNEYTDTLKAMQAVGMTWENGIEEGLGLPPVVIGIGVIWESELKGPNKNRGLDRSGGAMSLMERCQKRAQSMAIRQIIQPTFSKNVNNPKSDDSINFDGEYIDHEVNTETGEITEGEVTEGTHTEAPTPPQSNDNGDQGTSTSAHPERPWMAEYLRQAMGEKFKATAKKMSGNSTTAQVQKMCIGLNEAGLDDKEQYTVLGYLAGRELKSRKDLSKSEVSAIIEYNEKTHLETRQSELSAVIVADQIEKGQLELDMPDTEEEITLVWSEEERNTFEKLVTSARLGKVNLFITQHAKMSPAEFYVKYTPGQAAKFLREVKK